MNIELIRATKHDKPYLLNLRKITMVEHLEKSGQFLSDEEHEFRLNDAYKYSYIIHYESERIGTVKYQERDDKVEIMQIQIDPCLQGRGLGKKVMEHLLSSAKSKIVELTVLKGNPSIKLFKRLGFNITGEDEYEYHMQYTH